MVIRGAHTVTCCVGELKFNPLVIPTLFVQESGRNSPKAVTSHDPFITKSLERHEDGVIAHRLTVVAVPRE